MKEKIHLIRVIRSMTKSEKRHFSIYTAPHGKEKAYRELFRAAATREDYGSHTARSLLPDSYVARFHSAAKQNLYKTVRRSLRSFHEKISIETQARNLITDAEILFRRSLWDECEELLSRAETLCDQYEKLYVLNEIYPWKRKLIYEQALPFSSVKKALEELSSRESANREKLDNLLLLQTVHQRIFLESKRIGLARSKEEIKKLARIIHQQTMTPGKVLSYEAGIFFHSARIQYFFSSLNYKSGYREAVVLMDYMERNPVLLRENMGYYISAINSLITFEFLLKKFSSLRKSLHRFKALLTSLAKDNASRYLYRKLFNFLYSLELPLLSEVGEIRPLLHLVSEIEKLLDEDPDLMTERLKPVFYFQLSAAYYSDSNYKKALLWLNRLLDDRSFTYRQDIQVEVRFYAVLLYFEMGDLDLMDSVTRSIGRYLKRKSMTFEAESSIINFLKNILPGLNADQRLQRECLMLQNKLKNIRKKNKIERLPDFVDYWLESKIKGKSYVQVLRDLNT